MTSLWLDRPRSAHQDPFPADDTFEDVVVGAGLTGLVTAALLARAGRHVGVLEARHVGAVATGRTTAKASVLQGTKLSSLLRTQPRHRAEAYVTANQEGLAWLRRYCADHAVGWQERDAYVFGADAAGLGAAQAEHEAARALGLDVGWHDRLDVPWETAGAVSLAGQGQFDPVELLESLVDHIRAHGGTIHEHQRVVSASKTGRPRLELDSGRTVHADTVVLATGTPVLDRALTFSKVEAKRSYLLAYRGGGSVPKGMYLSTGASTRSYREVPTPEGGTFLVGGSGHTVGRTASELQHLEELRAWAGEHFPDAVETHAWSAQDYSPYDGLPLFGRLPLGGGHVWYATGYDKWGMTNGVAAALTIAAGILGDHQPSWAEALGRGVPRPRALLRAGSMNTRVGLAATKQLLAAEARRAPRDLPEGEGTVGRGGIAPMGEATVDGRTCRVLAVCTHLGGPLRWNDAEKSWDCPLHGSRFSADGQVLEGPATRALQRRDDGEADAVAD